jgi:hypothetical protein
MSAKGKNKKDLGTNYAYLNSLWETSVLSLTFHEYHIGSCMVNTHLKELKL